MGDKCINCIFFDQETTSLPICKKRKKYVSPEWHCGDHKSMFEKKEKS